MAEDAILGFLNENDEIPDSGTFASTVGIDHIELVNVIKSLHGFKLVDAQDIKREKWVLTDEGDSYTKSGSPEVQFFNAIPEDGITQADLEGRIGASLFKIGSQQAMKNKWVEIVKVDKGRLVRRTVEHVEDRIKDVLLKVKGGEVVTAEDIDALKRRKLIALQSWKGYSLKKGPNYTVRRTKEATDLTREDLQSGDWNKKWKPYNYNARGKPTSGASFHPLLKVREEIREIFTNMGYEEMPTNNFVESSFWNFDALFQPQQHPARDSHDTFFLQAPSTTKSLPEDYLERVKHVHESGGYGSKGYGYDWKREEAEKNVLRTHTTAVSSRMLYALAQEKTFTPKRYFSIDRVFRNEAVDRTHLAEFHQIEGLICDRGLTLGDLIGELDNFFSRLGMSKLQYKPAYNPYTEPSMEIFSYYDAFGKWIEIGNSGMFRPEMLLPMGLPEDVRVIAWGLSLERPTMILYGINNIRDLFGHKVDLNLIKSNPICRIGLNSETSQHV